MSVYPTGVDTFTPVVSGVSEIRAADINDLQSAITATQNAIGTTGNYSFTSIIPSPTITSSIVNSISENTIIYAVVVNSGIAYVGGNFTSINGVAVTGLAAIDLSDNSVVGTFDAELLPIQSNTYVESIAIQDSNNILVGGAFIVSGSTISVTGLASIDLTTGALNESFDAQISEGTFSVSVSRLVIDDSSVFAYGNYNAQNPTISKFDLSSGAADGSFSPQNLHLDSRAVGDGKLLVKTGGFSPESKFISSTDASVLTTFTGVTVGVYSPQSTEAFFVGSSINFPDKPARYGIAKMSDKTNIPGSFDNSFYVKAPSNVNFLSFATYSNYIIHEDANNNVLNFRHKDTGEIVSQIYFPGYISLIYNSLYIDGTTLYIGGAFTQADSVVTRGAISVDLTTLP